MTESQACIDFIKQKENMPLYLSKGMSSPRYDAIASKNGKEVWDIGYGTRFYPDGTPVTKNDEPITEEQASTYLKYYVDICCNNASNAITISLNQSQFDSLISFAYNEGITALKQSTLLKTINNDPCDLINIRVQFLRWQYSCGNPDNGLLQRRKEEFAMYISELDQSAQYYKDYLNYIGKTNF